MKGDTMPITDESRTNPTARKRLLRPAIIAIVVVAVVTGGWFGLRRSDKPRPRQHAPTAFVASTPNPDDAAAESATADSALRVDLGPDDLKKAQIQTVRVGIHAISDTLRVPGIVSPDEYREVHVTPLAGGVLREIPVVLGDHVRRGQTLAVIFSSELADAETSYLTMLAEFEADHKKLERTQHLVRLGAASQQELDDVTAEHATHEAHVRAALEKLKLYGATDRQIAALKQAEQIDANLPVPAPISGIVLTRNANLGLVTSPTQELFTVADLSTVWVMASLNERDFAAVPVGTTATVAAPAYPGRTWKGRVVYIQPQVDPTTRTAQARIEVANPDESLRIAMYTDVAFTSAAGKTLAVPESAVQAIGDKQYVFVPVKDSDGSFAPREVRLGPAANGFYPVLDGLKPNDEVVKEGSFILKAEAIRQHPEL
jgi:cobalt-zinc-cadmium efflux system membrane fusion protein